MDWEGFKGYIGKLDKLQQTNVIKLVHKWIHDGQQHDLFAKQTHFTECQAECGQFEYNQHYILCYVQSMVPQKSKYMNKLIRTSNGFKTATLINRALKYITMCVISKTEPIQRKFPVSTSASLFDTLVFQAWIE